MFSLIQGSWNFAHNELDNFLQASTHSVHHSTIAICSFHYSRVSIHWPLLQATWIGLWMRPYIHCVALWSSGPSCVTCPCISSDEGRSISASVMRRWRSPLFGGFIFCGDVECVIGLVDWGFSDLIGSSLEGLAVDGYSRTSGEFDLFKNILAYSRIRFAFLASSRVLDDWLYW